MSENTRVWWDGTPVRFIRWTEKGLVFNWDDPNETAIHMPRGTVMRLMAKGVLEIEGDLPGWAYRSEPIVPHENRVSPEPAPIKPVTQNNSNKNNSNKLSIIARLIKKLGGGDSARITH